MDYYEKTWRLLLEHLVGSDVETADRWIEGERRRSATDDMYFHEGPIWYMVPLFMPVDFKVLVPPHMLSLVAGRIAAAIQSGVATYIDGRLGDWDDVRRQLDDEIMAIRKEITAV